MKEKKEEIAKEVKKATKKAIEKISEVKKELKTKTYYDLTREEVLKYEKEFKETPGGKTIDKISSSTAILAFALLLMTLIIQIYLEIKRINTGDYLGFLLPLYLIAIIVALFDIWYYTRNFNGWLKNKYNIKRW